MTDVILTITTEYINKLAQEKESLGAKFLIEKGLKPSEVMIVERPQGLSRIFYYAKSDYLTNEMLTDKITALHGIIDEMSVALKFTLNSPENLYRPDKTLHEGLCPTFYHTLTYAGDMELIERTKKSRETLESVDKKLKELK